MTATYLGAEQALTDAYVEAQLAQAGIVVALEAVATGLSGRVFPDMAPDGTKYPFIVYQCQSPPRDVRGVGVVRVMVDTLYVVKAVAQTLTWDPLVPVAKAIDQAMTSADTTVVGDGLVLSSVRQEQFSLVTVESGKQFRHFGGQYRIQAQAEQ
jgi:hypothetical protein